MHTMSEATMSLAKRSADTALMPPPPLTKRIKRPPKVLDEDIYSEALSHIIARDFFPGLQESQAQQEFMDALDNGDKGWIRDAGRKLTQAMTPLREAERRSGRGTRFSTRNAWTASETPRNFVGDTPQRGSLGSEKQYHEQSDVDLDLSLSAFQSRYTSEDNESFNALLDKQNETRCIKHAFFQHGNKIPSARQIMYREHQQKLLENGSSTSSALATVNANGDARWAVGGTRPSEDLDLRPASVDSFPDRNGPRNHFMFQPDGVEDYLMTQAQQAELASNAPPKAVKYSATRFSDVTGLESDYSVPPSPSLSAVDAVLAGRPRPTASEPGYSGAETPRVNGYAFVDAEPTPSEIGIPVTDEEAEAAERELAMKLLPQSGGNALNPFNLAEHSKREALLMRLVEKQDKGRRRDGRTEKLQKLGITPSHTPTPRYSTTPNVRKGRTMTPAARRLAEQIGTPHKDKSAFKHGSGAGAQIKDWPSTPRFGR